MRAPPAAPILWAYLAAIFLWLLFSCALAAIFLRWTLLGPGCVDLAALVVDPPPPSTPWGGAPKNARSPRSADFVGIFGCYLFLAAIFLRFGCYFPALDAPGTWLR